jgi:hypothetical protein
MTRPTKPNFNVARLQRLTQTAYRKLVALQAEGVLQGETAGSITQLIFDLPGKVDRRNEELIEKRWKAAASITARYLGQDLTTELMHTIARHAAGWEAGVAGGIPFKEWDPLGSFIWAPIYVADVERLLKQGRFYRLRLKVAAGKGVGLIWEKSFPGTLLQMIMRCAGVLKYERYSDEDIGGIWFTAKASALHGLELTDFYASPSQIRYNRKLQAARKKECIHAADIFPAKFADKTCFNCWKGRAECVLSRHAASYVEKGECKNRHVGRIVKAGYCLSCINCGRFEGK